MPDFVNTFFEERVEQLFDLAGLAERLFSSAGLEYRIAGGLAAYLYVEEAEPDAGRLTKDIDIVVRRADLEKIAKAAAAFGLQHCHVAGVDMLVRPDQPSGRRAVHLYPEATPELGLPANQRTSLDLSGGPDPHEAHQLSRKGRGASQRSRRSRTHHAGSGGRPFAEPRRAVGACARTRVAWSPAHPSKPAGCAPSRAAACPRLCWSGSSTPRSRAAKCAPASRSAMAFATRTSSSTLTRHPSRWCYASTNTTLRCARSEERRVGKECRS